MFKRLFPVAALLLASSIQPLFADYTDLQTATAAVVDDQVVIQVDNPNTNVESAGVQLIVQVEDGSYELLTIPTVTYQSSSTSVVIATASAPIVRIIDDPDPISP